MGCSSLLPPTPSATPGDPTALTLWKEVGVILAGFGLLNLETCKTCSSLKAGHCSGKPCQQSDPTQALCQ